MQQIVNNEDFRRIVDSRGGFILNVRSKDQGMIHLTRCSHLTGFMKVPADFTNTEKFWSESKDELVAKAHSLGLMLAACKDCDG